MSRGTSHCNRERIPLGKSHNVKIIEKGFYKVLVACIKVTTGKEFHMVQAAWNVKASKRGFHKLQATCNVKKARAVNRKKKATKKGIEGSGKVQLKLLD